MRKELNLPSVHSRITQVNTTLGIRVLQLLPKTTDRLCFEINYSLCHARSRDSNLKQANLEWKAKTAQNAQLCE